MSHMERLRQTIREPEPSSALRTLVESFSQEGLPKAKIQELLEQFLVELQAKTDVPESAEDAVLDTLDALVGWCHPSARLLTEENSQ